MEKGLRQVPVIFLQSLAQNGNIGYFCNAISFHSKLNWISIVHFTELRKRIHRSQAQKALLSSTRQTLKQMDRTKKRTTIILFYSQIATSLHQSPHQSPMPSKWMDVIGKFEWMAKAKPVPQLSNRLLIRSTRGKVNCSKAKSINTDWP